MSTKYKLNNEKIIAQDVGHLEPKIDNLNELPEAFYIIGSKKKIKGNNYIFKKEKTIDFHQQSERKIIIFFIYLQNSSSYFIAI